MKADERDDYGLRHAPWSLQILWSLCSLSLLMEYYELDAVFALPKPLMVAGGGGGGFVSWD